MDFRSSLFLAALSLFLCLGCPKPPDPPPSPPPETEIVDLDVGLTPAERVQWRRTGEGSDLVPVAILRALIDVNTGETFDKSLPRYGFLPSPVGPDNPYGLPVGWTTGVPEYALLKTEFVGLNCSACHTAQLEAVREDGSRVAMRIDGGTNMADIEAFAVAAKKSVVDMLEDPIQTLLFVWRLVKLENPSVVQGPEASARLGAEATELSTEDARALLEPYAEAVQNEETEPADDQARALGERLAQVLRDDGQGAEPESGRVAEDIMDVLQAAESVRQDIQGLLDFLARYKALLKNRIELATFAITAIENPETPEPGPGRDDPWGIIRNTVFFTSTPLTAPTSIPALYSADEFVWYHADGNTNSVLQRNVAQALALGAYIDPETQVSSLHPRALFLLEDLIGKIKAPKWPEELLGAIDRKLAGRGQELFAEHCLACHQELEGTLYPPGNTGTDPTRADNFLRPLGGEDFWVVIPETIQPLMDFAFEVAGVTKEEIERYEPANPVWRGTGEYQARRLDGIWSTAPYLHNGSVPTLYDLLLPAAERTDGFQLGNRTYDPQRVGYVLTTSDPIFTYDASSTGGSNAGHAYGTDLSEEDRVALVEYLKTL